MIPASIQERGFDFLDLSYNKLAGKYFHAEAIVGNASRAQGSLFLKVNRLSGRFPSTDGIADIYELSALRGNLFGCGNIPEEDEYSDEYACGSEELDISMYVFVSVGWGLIMCLCLLHVLGVKGAFSGHVRLSRLCELFNFKKQVMYATYLQVNKEVADLVVVAKIRTFSRELHGFMKLFVVLVGIYVVACIPMYCLKISEYGQEHTSHTTHSYQYRWLLTAAYMRGEVSLLLLLFMWVSVICGLGALTAQKGALRRWLCPESPSTLRSSSPAAATEDESSAKHEVLVEANANTETDTTINDLLQPQHPSMMKFKLLLIFVVNAAIVWGAFAACTSTSLRSRWRPPRWWDCR